jgi:hypothetical protein
MDNDSHITPAFFVSHYPCVHWFVNVIYESLFTYALIWPKSMKRPIFYKMD